MVDVTGQAANVARNLRHRPVGAVREAAAMAAYSLRSTTTPDPVLAADWDLLVVLDACRADLFAEVLADGTDLPDGTLETRISPASETPQWLDRVFGTAADGALADVAYVSGNPFTASKLDAARFRRVEDVWRDAWDDDRGTVPPRPITDRAIEVAREGDAERLVVHYMQPHFPSLATADDEGVSLGDFGDEQMGVWDDLRFGRRSVAEGWAAYRENLERVLAEVGVLLSNVDAAPAVVTADHGNAFGEHGLYGHPSGVDVPCLREVPWFVTEATDEGTREVDREDRASDRPDESDIIADRLEDLGYKT